MFAFVTIGTNDLKSTATFYDEILLPDHDMENTIMLI